MMDITIRSLLEAKVMIQDALNNLELDLDIISNEGVTLRTNKLLLSQFSPILRNLLDIDKPSSPCVLYLPDVTAPALIHLLNVIKNGITIGRGSGYSIIKEVRDVAKILGFDNIPVLTFVVQRQSQPEEGEDLSQNVPAGSSEIRMRKQVSEEANGSNRMDIENNEYENATNVGESISSLNINESHTPGISVNNNDNRHGISYNNAGMEVDNRHGISYNKETPKTSGSGLCTFEPLKFYSTRRTKVLVSQSSKNSIKAKNKVEAQNQKSKVHVPHSSKKSSNIINKNVEVQVHEHKNREVTEAIKKVLKMEPNEEANNGNDSTSVLTKIPCGVCRKSYGNAGTLLVHAEQHGENKARRKCTLCSFSGTRTALLSHIRSIHTKEKLFQCPVCPKRFSTCRAKDQHEKKHK